MLFLSTQSENNLSYFEWIKKLFIEYWPTFLEGAFWTLVISLSATIIGLLIAVFLTPFKIQNISKRDSTIIRVLKKASNFFMTVYVEVLRGTPMMVQAMIIHYGLMPKGTNAIVSGIIIVSINTSAYIIEVLRGSIEAVDKGQMEAARSLGMTRLQAMFHIIIPQAFKNSIPSIGNEFVVNIKDTSVLNVIMVVELFFMSKSAVGKYYRFLEMFSITAAIYLVLTFTTTRILYFISKKAGHKKIKSYPTSQSN